MRERVFHVDTVPSPIMLQFLQEQIEQHNIHKTGSDFYLKLGYTVSGIDEDCPRGHRRYHLHKRLHK